LDVVNERTGEIVARDGLRHAISGLFTAGSRVGVITGRRLVLLALHSEPQAGERGQDLREPGRHADQVGRGSGINRPRMGVGAPSPPDSDATSATSRVSLEHGRTMAVAATGAVMNDEGHDAFTAFVAARGPALLRAAYLLTGNKSDAEDLLQTVLAKTYARWRQLRAPEAAEAYVRVGLARTAASAWRRRRREHLVGEVADAADQPPSEDDDKVWTLLQRLPPRQRAVLVLRYYEGLSEAEIAHTLRCAPWICPRCTSSRARRVRMGGPFVGGPVPSGGPSGQARLSL